LGSGSRSQPPTAYQDSVFRGTLDDDRPASAVALGRGLEQHETDLSHRRRDLS
jgi:hypothetical protein